jgi:hypothetical protein
MKNREKGFMHRIGYGPFAKTVAGGMLVVVCAFPALALTLDGDVYIDATDSGNVKRMSDNSVVLSAFAISTNVDGIVYNYMYNVASLDMQGHTIHGEKDPTASVNVPSAIWNVVGSVTNGGSFDSHNGWNCQ